jgi:hypothetical protein
VEGSCEHDSIKCWEVLEQLSASQEDVRYVFVVSNVKRLMCSNHLRFEA